MKKHMKWTSIASALLALAAFASSPAALAQSTGSGDESPKTKNKGNTKKKPKKPAKPKPQSFKVGPKELTHYAVEETSQRNEVAFTSQAPKEPIKGRSTKVVGHLDLNPPKLGTAEGRFAVEWKTLDTGNRMRNSHMMGPPWVNTSSYPEIVFTLTGIDKPKRKGRSGKSIKCKLLGTMAMNGKEKDIKASATLVYVEAEETEDGETVKEGIGIRSTFRVSLKDYDIKGRGIGDKVARKMTIKVSLFLARGEAPEEDATDADDEDEANEDPRSPAT